MAELSKKDDQEIVQLTLKRKDTFREIMRRYEKKLYWYVMRFVRKPHDAEDITQETLIKAYDNLPSFKKGHKFSSWIYRIAHNETMDFFRKKQKVVDSLSGHDECLVEALPSKEDILGTILKREREQAVIESLQKMPARYRKALVLFYYHDKSYEAISKEMGISPNSVGPVIQRARLKLREILESS